MALEVNLRPKEKIILEFGVSRSFFYFQLIGSFILAVLVVWLILNLAPIFQAPLTTQVVTGIIAIGIGFGLVGVGYAFYLQLARHYLITDQRIVRTVGWLSRQTVDADYENITDISISQDIFQRFILRVGYVGVNTAGSEKEEIQLELVDDPYGVSSKIRELSEIRLEEINRAGETNTIAIRTKP